MDMTDGEWLMTLHVKYHQCPVLYRLEDVCAVR